MIDYIQNGGLLMWPILACSVIAIAVFGERLLYLHRATIHHGEYLFFFSSRRRHTRLQGDWSSDVCSSDLEVEALLGDQEDVVGVEVLPHRGAAVDAEVDPVVLLADLVVRAGAHRRHVRAHRSEERRVGKECRSRWSTYH